MRTRHRLLCLIALIGALAATPCTMDPRAPLRIADGRFLLDGAPFQIISGEVHYARIPRAYWRDRLLKAQAMGLNTISTYVFWNLHEPRPGVFDFSGQLDVAAFVRTAQDVGLHVILRPGPYVCSEWDLGGIPAWLLADPSVVVRSTDPRFMAAAKQYLTRLGRELAPLQYARGGPIIAVQVENEYGSFDRDHAYMRAIRQAIVDAGFSDALLYTADGPDQLPDGALPDLPPVVNFGPGEAQAAFAALARFRPGSPLMAGEYWAGWFDQWGHPHHRTDPNQEAREIEWMLGQGGSINLYMFHGGTTFGFMNGANSNGGTSGRPLEYLPQTTSYDYDAALDEAGRPTKKFFLFRDVIARHRPGVSLPPLPPATPIIAIPRFTLLQTAPLLDRLPPAIASEHPKSMEALGQSYGYVLYRTHLTGPVRGTLGIDELHDYAEVIVNGRLAGTLDRRLDQHQIAIDVPAGRATLDLLVENSGRINFKKALRTDRKGITHAVTLDGREILDWEMFPLPMDDVSSRRFSTARAGAGPGFFRGTFEVSEPGDAFLDLRGWTKGAVWVNGHALGRFWNIGPRRTLYLPGTWLTRGVNTVVVFDLAPPAARTLAGLTEPILDAPPPAPDGGAR